MQRTVKPPNICERHRRNGSRPEGRQDVLLPKSPVFLGRPRLPALIDLFQIRNTELSHGQPSPSGPSLGLRVRSLGDRGEVLKSLVPSLIRRHRAIAADHEPLKQLGSARPVSHHKGLSAVHLTVHILLLRDTDTESDQLGVPNEVVAPRRKLQRVNAAFVEESSRHLDRVQESKGSTKEADGNESTSISWNVKEEHCYVTHYIAGVCNLAETSWILKEPASGAGGRRFKSSRPD